MAEKLPGAKPETLTAQTHKLTSWILRSLFG